jgi:type II secretory pathway component PulF
MYPATLIVFTIIAVIILLTKVVPTIVSLFPSQESLPDITKMTLWLSDFVQHRWYVIF